ncbi:MAG TPA: alpha/beta hydrolase [Thermoanaerobaculia bacterium]
MQRSPWPDCGRSLTVAIALVLIGCAAPVEEAPPPATAATAYLVPPPADYGGLAIDLGPCTPRGMDEEVRCGTYEVLEDRARPDGRRIGIRVVVLPATGETPAPDPLVLLPGGPGQGITAVAFFFNRILSPVREKRDLVLIDPRGTGASSPLHCPLPGSDEDPQSYLGDQFPVEALAACAAKLEADLTRYATPDVIQDLDEIRAALGYERINLYGISYGSRVALAYLRHFPSRARSAILNGVVPTSMRVPQHHAPDAQRALDLLFDECAADAGCAAAFPDLRDKFWAVHRRLAEEGPVTVALTDPKTAKPIEVELNLDLFNEEIRWRLYDEESNLVPILVQEAYDGDYAGIAELLLRLRRAVAAGGILAVGAFMSATCTEDTPFIDLAQAERLAAGTFLGLYRVEQQRAACEAWPRGTLTAGFHEPVRSEAPVLLLSGYRDPVTPPRWGEEVTRYLPNGRHVVLRQSFHTEGTPCGAEMVRRFLEDRSAVDLDERCAAEGKPTPFVLARDPQQPFE